MADTMTLEQVANELRITARHGASLAPQTCHYLADAIDAAIKQRDVIEADLLRLAGYEQAAGRLAVEKAEFRQRAERAEAELAALKARILPGAAKVEIADTDDSDGNPYGWVGGTLLSHNLIGKRVRLVVSSDD